MPKALISYFFKSDSIPLGFSCARALERLGWTVERFHSQKEHPLELYGAKYVNRLLRGLTAGRLNLPRDRAISNENYRESLLELRVRQFRPNLLLVIRGNSYRPDFLRRMKREYAIDSVVGWWVKDPRQGPEMRADAAAYDCYFCIHESECSKEAGIHHLPATAVDRELYPVAASREESLLTHGIVQVGGYGERRHRFLAACNGLPIEIYGPGWRKGGRFLDPFVRHAWAGKGVWGKELIHLYHGSRIVVNVTNWESVRQSGQNLRIMDVPSTGALLLTDESDEVRRYFTPGQDIETFSSPEELADKARFYLQRADLREAIARRGYERTLKLPTYDDRMRKLINAIPGAVPQPR